MRFLLVKILFHLLNLPHFTFFDKDNVDKDNLLNWMANTYPLPEFKNYVKRRDLEILQHLGSGQNKNAYLLSVGERINLGVMMGDFKKAYLKLEKENNLRKTKK